MIELWSMTDIGLLRKENQDSFMVVQDTPTGHTICVVCDGMGGSAGGSLASTIAVETFTSELQKMGAGICHTEHPYPNPMHG